MLREEIVPPDSSVYSALAALVSRRIVLFAGLPGVGKSLLLKQLALLAGEAGRDVHLFQWDVTRGAFETPDLLARYPETGGVTHAAIRKGVGLWARGAVAAWHLRQADDAILIGEIPLIGNRLVELAQVRADEVEPLLAGEETLVVVVVPSRRIRSEIEGVRAGTIASPRHEREAADAPPGVIQMLSRELHRLGETLGLAQAAVGGEAPYTPEVYAGVYRHLLRHRNVEILEIDELFQAKGSVYDLTGIAGELVASPQEVADTLAYLERNYTPEEVEREVENWFEI